MNDVISTIYARRAVRKYKSQQVDQHLISQIIDAGRMAPSAMNRQPWSFYVLTEKTDIQTFSKQIARAGVREIIRSGIKKIVKTFLEVLRAPIGFGHIGEKDFVFYGAPVVIFITAPKDNEWASLDIGMCCQNMMLAAKSLGLDSCPIGFGKFVDQTKSYPSLRIPPEEQVMIALILGYGDDQPEMHERRKGNVFFISPGT
jgi:nitroreductase